LRPNDEKKRRHAPSDAAKAAKGRQKPSTPKVRPPIQPKTGTICAGSAFIWRISVNKQNSKWEVPRNGGTFHTTEENRASHHWMHLCGPAAAHRTPLPQPAEFKEVIAAAAGIVNACSFPLVIVKVLWE
jgi:hypothetical protein